MTKLFLTLLLCLALVAPAFAQQLMPPPHAAPHMGVERGSAAATRQPPRDLTGVAAVIDGDKFRMGEYEFRLFGVVPPQLSASFGPQARAELDAVMGGKNVSCHVRDRDHDGRLLANCVTENNVDPAMDLLRHGLAVAARGSIAETELAQPYAAAENAAQNAKLAIWSETMAPAAEVAQAKAEPPPPKVIESKVAEKPAEAVAATTALAPRTSSLAMAPYGVDDAPQRQAPQGFFARYQILIAGFLMLATALSIIAALSYNRRTERRDEMRALAAALRGELQAARAVCQTRMREIMDADSDRGANWPRIRSTLYQAYVGRLGWLGAELARQVASIYGLANDYASYYSTAGEGAASMPKKQALQALVGHIDEVLPRLAGIEQTGSKDAPNVYAQAAYHAAAPMPMPEAAPVPALTTRMAAITSSVPPAAPVREQTKGPPSASAAPQTIITPPPSASAASGERIEDKLRSAMRSLRERFVEPMPHAGETAFDDSEYTSLIEEDIERYAFGGDDDSDTLGKIGRH